MSRLRNIQELFLICKPLWFILFRRLSWKKHVWRVAGAWRRVALKQLLVLAKNLSVIKMVFAMQDIEHWVRIVAGLPVNKLFDIQRLEQKQNQFLCQFLCHPNWRNKPATVPENWKAHSIETTTKASWIWFPGSNDFWWSNGQRHRDLRGVCNPGRDHHECGRFECL